MTLSKLAQYAFGTLVILTMFLVLGVIGRFEYEAEQVQQQSDMKMICERSYLVNDGPLEEACGNAIDRVQADGKHEVLSNEGKFWVEEK